MQSYGTAVPRVGKVAPGTKGIIGKAMAKRSGPPYIPKGVQPPKGKR